MRDQVLDVAPLGDQFPRPLFAHPRHTGNIVGGVAPQGQNVDHLLRIGDAVVLAHFVQPDDVDPFAPLRGFVHADVLFDQLAVVFVGGDHEYVVLAAAGGFVGQGADHVIGFITGHLQNGDPHGLQNRFDVRHGGDDIFRRGIAVGFIEGVEVAPEGASRRVESDAEVFRLLADDQFVEEFGEAENGGGVQPLCIAHGPVDKGVVETEDQGVGVDQEEFLHRAGLRFIGNYPLPARWHAIFRFRRVSARRAARRGAALRRSGRRTG